MTIKDIIKNFFIRLFGIKPPAIEIEEQLPSDSEIVEMEEQLQKKFELKNVIMEKLDYLEQYIKIFSLTFPNEYDKYKNNIQSQRESYEAELKSYVGGFNGNVTFAIDPEKESGRLMGVLRLEKQIKNFVEFDVNYQVHKDKFLKLCVKFNNFYNALIDTKRSITDVERQMQNANNSLLKLIQEVKEMTFFEMDSRKKEDILSYVIYCDYIIFKSKLRCHNVKSFDDYLETSSVVYELFVEQDYKNIAFGYFINDLEWIQEYVVKKFNNSYESSYLLQTCQDLQQRLPLSKTLEEQEEFFQELIKFENTIDNLVEKEGKSFVIEVPNEIKNNVVTDKTTSVNKIAIAFLDMMGCLTAKILLKVIASFKYEISWREFYFLCKIFEIYDEVIEFASSTIFDTVKNNFIKLDNKYVQYTEEYIRNNKLRLLKSSNTQSQKYILFLTPGSLEECKVKLEFERLHLDYKFENGDFYLNYSYFKGFKNLEQNFGNYVIM